MQLITRRDKVRQMRKLISDHRDRLVKSRDGIGYLVTLNRFLDRHGEDEVPDAWDAACRYHGYSSRMSTLVCDECRAEVEEAVHFDIESDEVPSYQLCCNCLLKAMILIEP